MRNLTRFLRRGQNLLGLLIVACYVAVAIAAPILAPRDGPQSIGVIRQVGSTADQTPHPPSTEARLGTLPRQYDIYFTLVWGTRTALTFGFVVAVSTAILGTLVGAVSGYLGGWAQKLTMPVVDAFLTFPAIAGYFLVQYVFFPVNLDIVPSSPVGWLFVRFGLDSRSLMTPIQKLVELLRLEPLMLTLILFSWMPYARIINAATLRLRQVDYIQASRALGASRTRIIFRHLLPNIISPALVLMARDFGGMVVLSAAFTFIGMSGSSPWGAMIAAGRDWIIGPGGNPFFYWWTYLPATLALLFFGIGWNLIGDGLNSMLTARQAPFEQGPEPAKPASVPALLPEDAPLEATDETAIAFETSPKGLLARAKRRTGRLPPLDEAGVRDIPRIGDAGAEIAHDDISSVARLMGASRFRELVSAMGDPLNPALLPESLLEDLPDETRQLLAQVKPPQLPSTTSGRPRRLPSLRRGLPPLRQTREFITGVLRSIEDRIIEDPPPRRKHTAPFNRPPTPPKPASGRLAASVGAGRDAASPPPKARVCPNCKAVVPGPNTHCPNCDALVPPAPVRS